MIRKKKFYTSEIDLFLKEFASKNALSDSQQAEIEKYREIARKRDHAVEQQPDPSKSIPWDKF